MFNVQKLHKRLINSRLVNDSFWAIFGNVLGKGLSLLTVIIIARILGKEIYGEFGIVHGTIASILIFTNFGLNYTSTKYIAEYHTSKPELLSQIIKSCQQLTVLFSGFATIVLFFAAEYIAIHLLKAPKLTFFLQLISINILIGSICRTQEGILAGLSKFKDLAKINTIIGVGNFLFGVLLTYFYGLTGAFISSILLQILDYFLLRYFINKYVVAPDKDLNKKISLKEILKFSTPVALQEAFYSIITYSTGLLLVQLSTYGEVGLSSAALYWSAIILYIPGILRNVILSHLSANLSNDKARLRILRIILVFNFCVTFLLSVTIYFLSDFISSSYGDNFSGLKDVINISVFTTIFVSMSNVYAQAYMSESKNWLMLFFRIIRDGSIFGIAYYLLTVNDGVHGALLLAKSALWANILFLILMGVVYEISLHRKLKTI
ncbi:oligosaccharide flippase family protein [Arenibacter troitsensis]|uniref:Na+-driven multidrug efflux pump n=1 Tax=Arenibacter troitsensis TaxID=188872 RepID=A0A1X7IYB7_9FLAO|nr:oligosaccharide flippase family protein [Arenibacter troitsensis]SMG20140.1 Na+-driven multidrug efflux pump [Arenibacter troitsensis]